MVPAGPFAVNSLRLASFFHGWADAIRHGSPVTGGDDLAAFVVTPDGFLLL